MPEQARVHTSLRPHATTRAWAKLWEKSRFERQARSRGQDRSVYLQRTSPRMWCPEDVLGMAQRREKQKKDIEGVTEISCNTVLPNSAQLVMSRAAQLLGQLRLGLGGVDKSRLCRRWLYLRPSRDRIKAAEFFTGDLEKLSRPRPGTFQLSPPSFLFEGSLRNK